jgi:diguanylate cyclase (GGDEF)-like protein
MDRCRRDATPVSVIMFDLDRFKAINDRHGHATGDAVLRKFCEIAAGLLRPNDLLGRLGGEEFAAMLPGSSVEAAYARAERIRVSFAENCRFVRGQQVNATVSGGVLVSVNADEALEALLENTDAALYIAKTEGRNRIKHADQRGPEGTPSNVFRVA